MHETGHYYLSDGPLPFGKLALCQSDYREFCCSRETAAWLMGGAMRYVNEQPVHLQIMDECVGGHNVWVKIWTTMPDGWLQPSQRASVTA